MHHSSPTRSGMRSPLPCLLAATAFLAGSLSAQAQAPASVAHNELARPTGMTPRQVWNGSAIRVSHYEPTQMLRLALTVKPPHMAEEEKFLNELVTKGSPNFHKFLTPKEWDARFGPSVEDEQKVVDWAVSQGLTITNRYPNRLLVDVEAPAGVIERAFGVTINNYKVGGEVEFSNDRDPAIPAELTGSLGGVLGLNSIQRVHGSMPLARKMRGPDYVPGPVVNELRSSHGDGDLTKATSNSIRGGVEDPAAAATARPDGITADYATVSPFWIFGSEAYDYNALHNLSHCCNVHSYSTGAPAQSSIALVTFGDFQNSDVQAFFKNYGFAWDYNSYTIDGYGRPGQDDEAPGDLEYSTATANSFGSYLDTAKVFVYEINSNLYSAYADAYNTIATNNTARVISTSYGGAEEDWNTDGYATGTAAGQFHGIFNTMAGEGYTLIASAGDSGSSQDCRDAVQVNWPASDPNFIAAGGTALDLDSNGNYVSEVAWTGDTWSGACSSNWGGGGGGASKLFSKPSWQNSLTGTMRLMPDISLNADPDTTWESYYYNGGWSSFDGTSIVAPELAGFFAQENSYLDYLGNICGTGTTACTPLGNAAPSIYDDGVYGAPHKPFYDITSGCNSNDITALYSLTTYCATTGYDQATGWGSANMMQLAWGINWWVIPAIGNPSVNFSGPAANTWFNTDRVVSWTLSDSGGSLPAPGPAGFTQGWDTLPADPTSEPHGGSGNSFYSGPEFPFGTTGCLDLAGTDNCGGGSGQGCHTVKVQGWDNQGRTTIGSYGPVCYDSVAPTISTSTNPVTSGTVWVNSSVVVTLNPADSGGSNASGIYKTYYAINTGSCTPGNLGACSVYTAPFTVSGQQQSFIYYFTEDNAGNFSGETYIWVSIDLTAPVTTLTLGGGTSGIVYDTAVNVSLNATDTGGSGPKTTYYQLDGGAATVYGGAFNVTALGSHTLKYWSVDSAGNVEATHTSTFAISSPTASVVSAPTGTTQYGQPLTLTATVVATLSGIPTGTVSFMNGASVLGTATLGGGGVATFTTSSLPVGSYSITAVYAGASVYLASTSTTFNEVITPAPLYVTAYGQTKVYGAALPTFTYAFAGFVNGDTVGTATTGVPSLSTTATVSSPVGTYPINVAGGTLAAPNYTFKLKPGILTVTQAALYLTADNTSKVYGAAVPGLNATLAGFVNGDTVATATTGTPTLSTTATASSPVGTYPITPLVGTLSAPNYTLKLKPGVLTVTGATLYVTANSPSSVYGAATPAFTAIFAGFVNGDTAATAVTGVAGFSTAATAASPVGSYPVTPTAGTLIAPNYSFKFKPGTLTITPALLYVTADSPSKVYGASLPAFTVIYSGFVNGDTAASATTGVASFSTTATAASPVGSYPVTPTAGTLTAANYTFKFKPGTLTVTPATLYVTAYNQTIAQGAPLPHFTYAFAGFVNGDTVATATTGAPVLSTTATSSSPAGTYPINVAAGTLTTTANYTLKLKPGTLTIN